MIRDHSGLRATVRLALTPFVWMVSWLMQGAPGLPVALMALGFIAVIGMVRRMQRIRH